MGKHLFEKYRLQKNFFEKLRKREKLAHILTNLSFYKFFTVFCPPVFINSSKGLRYYNSH